MTLLDPKPQIKEMSTMAEEDEHFWRRHYELYKTTGESRSQYAREKGVNYHRFVYWTRKFAGKNPGLIAVKLKEPIVSSKSASLCKLHFRNGCELSIYDLATLSFIFDKMS